MDKGDKNTKRMTSELDWRGVAMTTRPAHDSLG